MRQRVSALWSAFLLAAALPAWPLQAQEEPEALLWQERVERVAGADDQVDLVLTAQVHEGWIVYGSDFEPGDFGPRPARLVVQAGGQAVQPVRSDGAQQRTGSNFAGEYHYTYFDGVATFRQRVRVEAGARQVSGVLNGQSCYEASGLCTLFREPFAIALE
ncbi:disulfide bond formation protein DsbD [Pseudoxanthomonas sp. NC8]|nr:disulfide bond formation protein DsbD [Pseudoxanthomonas sp. NC8]